MTGLVSIFIISLKTFYFHTENCSADCLTEIYILRKIREILFLKQRLRNDIINLMNPPSLSSQILLNIPQSIQLMKVKKVIKGENTQHIKIVNLNNLAQFFCKAVCCQSCLAGIK